jgi:hypothetical protein
MTMNEIFIRLFSEGSINSTGRWHKLFRRAISSERFMIEVVLNRFNTGVGKERQNCCCAQKPME